MSTDSTTGSPGDDTCDSTPVDSAADSTPVESAAPGMPCKFEGCGIANLAPETGNVPLIKFIANLLKRRVLVRDLEGHVYCERHTKVLREQGVVLFTYAETVVELERRAANYAAERETARSIAAAYGAEKPKRGRRHEHGERRTERTDRASDHGKERQFGHKPFLKLASGGD